MSKRYLTKSKYKLALECPRKLWYHDRKKEYENKKLDDPFLMALAAGGFQVGELAKCYYPGGHDVEVLAHQQAIKETNELLKQENVIIYEPAIAFEDFFVRVDVLVKQGNDIKLLEVKAKSFRPEERDDFFDKRELKQGRIKLKESWKPYLYDVAFQTWVCQSAKPAWNITPCLVLADKSKKASVDGLNQRFFLSEEGGRSKVTIKGDVSLEALGDRLLCEVDVTDVVEAILAGTDNEKQTRESLNLPSFADEARHFGRAYVANEKLTPCQGGRCKSCEFRSAPESWLKSGFHECWKEWGVDNSDLQQPMVFDIWNFRGAGKAVEENGIVLARDITEEDLRIKEGDGSGLSASQRQWEQISRIKEGNDAPYVNREGLQRELAGWKYPLHFIDFETTMVAIPFNAGRRPYEQLAFQFSHHVMEADGSIRHAGQYLHDVRGEFPNFHFLRALKKELEGDEGTIFRYAAHENTVLCQIHDQLEESDEPDKVELQEFVRSITKSTGDRTEPWEGERNMVDLLEVLKRHYYDPYMGGSNSIKKLLPAVLKRSERLQERYACPVYGTSQMPSLNLTNKVWIEFDSNGHVKDPYKSLPPVFDEYDREFLDERVMSSDELADGGAAMMAYARMQFTEMSEVERKKVREALLRYCELDTMAMVMVVEYWKELAGDSSASGRVSA